MCAIVNYYSILLFLSCNTTPCDLCPGIIYYANEGKFLVTGAIKARIHNAFLRSAIFQTSHAHKSRFQNGEKNAHMIAIQLHKDQPIGQTNWTCLNNKQWEFGVIDLVYLSILMP